MSKFRFIFLLLPVAFVAMFSEIAREPMTNDGLSLFFISIIVFWSLTVWILVSYVKKVPFNPWLLPASFLLSPSSSYIYDTIHTSYWQNGSPDYTVTIMVVQFYALPFMIASIIIAAILSIRRKIKINSHMALLLPSIFAKAFTLIGRWHDVKEQALWIFIATFYLLTILGIALYVKYVPFSPWLLSASFVSCPLLPYIDDSAHSAIALDYMPTILVTLCYAFPFLIVSVIIATIVLRRKETGGTKNQY